MFRRKPPASKARTASSHWIDGPSEMARSAMAYFNTPDLSQKRVLDKIAGWVPFASVADFGTGRGAWLKAALDRGVTDVTGYDIPEIDVSQRMFPADRFIPADLGKPLALDRRFDLAISTEVAEHLPYEHAATFIAIVGQASDLVLFSAAIPYQEGAGHVNENWVEYWVRLFQPLGFACYDVLRMPLWNDASIRSYYRQNLLVFARATAAETLERHGLSATAMPPSLVHPEQYLKAVGRALPPEMATVGADVRHYYDCVTKTPAEIDANPNRPTYGRKGIGWGAVRKHLGL